MLEVIDKSPVGQSAGQAHPAPLLFVHGAWHAAWCWDEHFLDFFAGRGYRALALSFRGHGTSATDKPLADCGVDDYLADLRTVAEGLPAAPVLIGHSMGGLIVQKYLEEGRSPAAVLMASMPPRGNLGSSWRWLRTHPVHAVAVAATGNSLRYVSTPTLARERFFSKYTPEADVVRYAARLQPESKQIGIDCLARRLPRPSRVNVPVLVLGAELDGAHTAREVNATARAYRTEAEFFPDMGHNMMLEAGWQAVAERIDGWLVSLGL